VLFRLAVPPKKSVLIDYSYRLSHDRRLRLLVVLDGQRIGHGLATAERAILSLDFHAIMRWGATSPGEATRPPDSPRTRSAPTFIPRTTAPTT